MFIDRNKAKVFDPIIKFIPVKVMNRFFGIKFSSYEPFHQLSMYVNSRFAPIWFINKVSLIYVCSVSFISRCYDICSSYSSHRVAFSLIVKASALIRTVFVAAIFSGVRSAKEYFTTLLACEWECLSCHIGNNTAFYSMNPA